jgi:hypothetical protein
MSLEMAHRDIVQCRAIVVAIGSTAGGHWIAARAGRFSSERPLADLAQFSHDVSFILRQP